MRIDYFLRDLSRGIGRIQQGQVPDGSGTLITDVKLSDIYWVLLGRSGGQTGFGGTGPSQNARIASTTDATKGLIYLGTADLAAFDETNTRLGIGTVAATAKVHIIKNATDPLTPTAKRHAQRLRRQRPLRAHHYPRELLRAELDLGRAPRCVHGGQLLQVRLARQRPRQ